MAHERLAYLKDGLDLVFEKLNLDVSEFKIVPGMAVPSNLDAAFMVS